MKFQYKLRKENVAGDQASWFSNCATAHFVQVNKVDFAHFTREEAANFLLNIRSGERVEICTQNKMDREFAPPTRSLKELQAAKSIYDFLFLHRLSL